MFVFNLYILYNLNNEHFISSKRFTFNFHLDNLSPRDFREKFKKKKKNEPVTRDYRKHTRGKRNKDIELADERNWSERCFSFAVINVFSNRRTKAPFDRDRCTEKRGVAEADAAEPPLRNTVQFGSRLVEKRLNRSRVSERKTESRRRSRVVCTLRLYIRWSAHTEGNVRTCGYTL